MQDPPSLILEHCGGTVTQLWAYNRIPSTLQAPGAAVPFQVCVGTPSHPLEGLCALSLSHLGADPSSPGPGAQGRGCCPWLQHPGGECRVENLLPSSGDTGTWPQRWWNTASLGVAPSCLETNPAFHPCELIPFSPSSLLARINVSEAARGPALLIMVVIQIISGLN